MPLPPLSRTLLLPSLVLLAACDAKWQAEDVDGDGFTVEQGDCWDDVEGPEGSGLTGADFNPGISETWYDGYDQDCARDHDYDADGDGFVPAEYWGLTTYSLALPDDLQEGDCWDDPAGLPDDGEGPVDGAGIAAADTHPGASDSWYDGVDQDCAGDSDFDQDLDGHDSSSDPRADGSVGPDCDDLDDQISPDAVELCDDVDNDCDGLVDGDDDSVDPASVRDWYLDDDGDGYGADDSLIQECDQPSGYVAADGDCADDDPDRNPGQDELCNDIDDDCNGAIDEAAADAPDWFADADGDGYGDPDDYVAACDNPGDRVDNDLDCDDDDAAISPDADELCATAGTDDDCDGVVDEDDAIDTDTFYQDDDGDLYGVEDITAQGCSAPIGYVETIGDCDDGDAAVNPGAEELCATVGVDDDCDGETDEDDASDVATWYRDADDDGFGDGTSTALACDAPDGFVDNTDDCDDDCADCWTGADEVCNDYVDNDCDGTANTCAVAATVDLSELDLRVDGGADGDDHALTLAAGDVDGDGQPDLITGARKAGDGGEAYLFLGPIESSLGTGDADTFFEAGAAGDAFGRAVSLLDLDGDGFDDVVISAPSQGNKDKGRTYVWYGPVTDASLAVGSADARFDGEADFDYFSPGLGPVGDLAGDSAVELALAVPLSSFDQKSGGAVYIVSGAASGTADASAAATAIVTGANKNDNLGSGFAGPGDVDGDGFDDLVVGAWKDDDADNDAGAVFVYQGPLSGTLTPGEADATWLGIANGDWAGDVVGAAGDIDEDGLGDVLVGAYGRGSDDTGEVYLLLSGSVLDGGSLADADAVFTGASGEQLGTSAAGIGDLDMDGVDDFAFGNGDRTACGASSAPGDLYVFFGVPSGSTALTDADVVVSGAATGDCAGAVIGGGADLSGDGYLDLLLGAPGAADGAGSAVVVEGVGM